MSDTLVYLYDIEFIAPDKEWVREREKKYHMMEIEIQIQLHHSNTSNRMQ